MSAAFFAIQHVPFEEPAGVADWFRSKGMKLDIVHVYEGVPLPDPADVAGLVVMGGPMSVNDAAELRWLAAEREFLRAVIARRTPVLGICLGAQLIADVSGGRVTRNPEREIGWLDVAFERSPSLPGWALKLPSTLTVLHWHGETFSVPKGFTNFARSDGCTNQAIVSDDGLVLGLQFHLEATVAQLEDLKPHLDAEYHGPGERYVEEPRRIVEAAARHVTGTGQALDLVLSALFC